jgi:PAS domain S-box-containing protein
MTASSAAPDFQSLFRALPDNYLLLAPDGTVVDNTDAHVAVSLLPREQAQGQNIFAAYPSAAESQRDLAESHEYVRRHLTPHTMPLLRYDLERPAALGGGTEERYWEVTHFPILDESGELRYILQRPQDVTAKHLATQQAAKAKRVLEEMEEHTRFVLETVPVMVWTAKPDGRAESFNARWLDYTGRSRQDSLGLGWLDDLHPDDRARTLSLWEQGQASGQPYQAEYRMRRHDGQYRWHLAQARPRLDAAGQIVLWVGCNADIHAQKSMVEELLIASEQQAQLSEQSYQNHQLALQQRQTFHDLLMRAPALVAIVRSPEHRYEFVNPPYQQLFAQRQLLGKTVAEAVPEVVEQGFIDILDNVYRTGEPFQGNEVPIQLDRDGSGHLTTAYFNFTYQRFMENGQPAGITAFASEITELVMARKALAQLQNGAAPTPAASSVH